jgi:hypothetical protein
MNITSYFFIVISGLVSLLFFLRAIKLASNGKILKHKVFDFPEDKYYKIGYCLCICVLGLIAIYFRFN